MTFIRRKVYGLSLRNREQVTMAENREFLQAGSIVIIITKI